MDVFTLVGKISVEIQEAMDNIQSVINKVKELDGVLNGTDVQTSTQTAGETVTSATEEATEKTGSALSKWSVMMGNLATQVANKVYGAGKSFFQTGFEYNQNMEKWASSFQTYLGGDLDAAKTFLEELRQFAIDTPLSMQDVVQEAVNLLGAGFDVDDVISALWQIGDMSKGDNAVFTRVARAYWQGMGKPHLNMQDANQLVEVGVPIWQMIADYFNAIGRDGKTDWTKDFVSNLGTWSKEIPGFEHEMVTNEEFREAIAMATSENGMFYNAMLNLMDTEYGQAQKMMDSYEQAAGAFTSAIFEVFKSDTIPALSDILERLNEWATENPDALKNLADAFSNFATNGLDVLLKGLTGIIDFWNQHEGVFKLMTAILGGLLMVTGHPVAGLGMLVMSEAVDESALDALSKTEDGQYRTNILIPGVTQQMNDGMSEDGEAGRYHYFSEKARALAETMWDMERQGLTGKDVSGWETFMSQAYAEFGKIATELGVADTQTGVAALMTDLINQMLLLDKTNENLPDAWFYDPNKVKTTDYTLHPQTVDPSMLVGSTGGANAPLIAAMQSLVSQMRSEVSAGAQEGVANGLSGVTLTGTVTTGTVKLDTGAVVGELTPMFDMKLGAANALASRG